MKQSLTMFHSMHAMVYSYQFWVIPGTFFGIHAWIPFNDGEKINSIFQRQTHHSICMRWRACIFNWNIAIQIRAYFIQKKNARNRMKKNVTFLIRHRKYTSTTLLNGWLRFLMFLLNLVTMWIYNYYFGKKQQPHKMKLFIYLFLFAVRCFAWKRCPLGILSAEPFFLTS